MRRRAGLEAGKESFVMAFFYRVVRRKSCWPGGVPWLVVMVLLGVVGLARAEKPMSNDDCLECHGDATLVRTNADKRVESLFVEVAKLAGSVHKTNTCAGCHADLTRKHPDDNVRAKVVDCARCHPRESKSYGASVHGLAAKGGQADAATCRDCHDTHNILPPTLPGSPLYFTRQGATCGGCHDKEAAEVAGSVHGKATANGFRDAPVCTDCHSEHQIQSLKQSTPEEVSRVVCAKCHSSERINTKFNLPGDRVDTFFNSYHGLAAQYGSTVAADCASCHGYHRILPSSDTNSTINRLHLVETCGKCHRGANANFSLGKVHVDAMAGKGGEGWGGRFNTWVRRVYLVLIFGVVGAMFVHNFLIFARKVRRRLRAVKRPVARMSLVQRWQHGLLAGSFIVLAVSGFALKYSDSWVAHLLGSNEVLRRWTHRVSGVVMLAVGLSHLVYLLRSKEGRQLVRDLMPARRDLTDALGTVAWLAGCRKEKPPIGRFGYSEKMEYWAVVWGTIIMGLTGLMIWLKLDVTEFVPRWVVDVALTIHYYEAVLACLAIVVWHFYHVMFDPDVYPLNPACWDGRVSEHWQREEHPLEKLPERKVPAPTAPPKSPGDPAQGH